MYRTPNTKIITVEVDKDIWKKLHSMARARGMLFNVFMRMLIKKSIFEKEEV